MALDDARDRVGPDGASAEQAASQVGAMVADRVRTALASAERAAADLRRRALDQASADREAVRGTAALVSARIDLIEAEVGHLLTELREQVALIVAEADRAAHAALHDAAAEPAPHDAAADAAPHDAAADATPHDAAADAAPQGAAAESAPQHAAAEPDPVQPPAVDEQPQPDDAEPPHPDDAAEEPGEDEPAVAPPPGAANGDTSPAAAGRRRGGLFRRRSHVRACGVCGRAPGADESELERWQQSSGTSLCPECQAAGWQLPERGKVPYRSAHPAARS
jgi:hypothetical protein